MRKTIYISVIISAILALMAFAASAFAAIPVEVAVGKGTIVTLKKTSKKVALADPAVADLIIISARELLINGKKEGATSLIVWDEEEGRTFFDVIVREELKATIEPPQVLLEVKVAQIDRNKLRELGLGFLAKGNDAEVTTPGLIAGASGNVGGGAGFEVTPGINSFDISSLVPQIGVAYYPSGIAAVLRALSEKGLAKVLAEPNLVVRSGENGAFLAGSRVPVQQVTGVGSGQTVSVVYEEVGVKLHFSPQVLESGTIRLKIDPAEVSNITRFIQFLGIIAPEIDTRTVRTSVDLKEGESLVLAGLLNEEMKKNIQKIPLLGDIPILGALFRSTREELERTELAFFITPKLVKPTPPGQRPELPGEKLKPGEEKEFNWIPIPSGTTGTGEDSKTETGKTETGTGMEGSK